ncbi:MAG: hypothetical protein ACP5RI_02890 [Candidatus Micrarchaeia archaeon]
MNSSIISIGSIEGSALSSFSVLQYLPYILAIIFIGGFIFWLKQKKDNNTTKNTLANTPVRNRAIILSLKHSKRVAELPFTVKRFYDPERNVEETRAIFPSTKPKQGFFAKIGEAFTPIFALLSHKPMNTQIEEEDKGVAFNEAIAISNETGGWDTIYTLEENLQLPYTIGLKFYDDSEIYNNLLKSLNDLKKNETITKENINEIIAKVHDMYTTKLTQVPFVTNDEKIKKEIEDLTRATEKRISRLKQLQVGISNYIKNAQPQTPITGAMIVGIALLAILILIMVMVLNQTGTQITNLVHVMGQLVNVTATLKH